MSIFLRGQTNANDEHNNKYVQYISAEEGHSEEGHAEEGRRGHGQRTRAGGYAVVHAVVRHAGGDGQPSKRSKQNKTIMRRKRWS